MRDTLFLEDFETDGNGNRYATADANGAIAEFSDGNNDFFTRTDGSNIASSYEVTGFGGSYYFAAQDLDGEGASLPLTLSFSDIDIEGYTDLAFFVALAEDDDGSNEDWDVNDYVTFEYSIDGGAFQTILGVQSQPDGDDFNAVPAIDFNLDGIGDGIVVTDGFTLYGNGIGDTGSRLDLRVTFNLDSGDEDIALDNLEITGARDGGTPDAANLVISEIMYNPASSDTTWEWIEVFNAGTSTVDLSGFVLDDINSIAVSGANIAGGSIAPGASAVLYDADDLSEDQFKEAWGEGINLVGVTEWNVLALNNGGDTISLWQDFDAYAGDNTTHANALVTVTYDDSGDWPADDNAGSIYLTDLSGDANDGTLWAPSSEGVFTPVGGAAYTSRDAGGNSGADVGSPGGILPPPPMSIPAPYSFDFETSFTEEGWTTFSVDADTSRTWFADSFSGDNFAEVNAFGGSTPANDWLISPLLDLSGLSQPVASFENTKNFEDDGIANPEVSFLYSTDYTGSGDPTLANWTAVPYSFSGGGFEDTFSGDLDISAIAGETAYFAFQYVSSGNGGGSSSLWQVDNFSVGDPLVAPPPQTVRIHEVQGNGAASPLVDQSVSVTGVVTGVFADLNGFFLQEEDADQDGDASTSEGIFVFAPFNPALEEGYTVTVTGTVSEFSGETQIEAFDVTVDSTDAAAGLGAISPALVDLPAVPASDIDGFYEPFEGMLVQFTDRLTVTQLFNYERFGEVQLSEGGRIYQYTQTNAPDVAGNADYQEEQAARRIILDDGSSEQNPDTIPFVADDTFGGGDTIDNLTGVLDFGFGSFRVQPTEANPIRFDDTNPREESPEDVGGRLKVASFNVLNYFTTLDTPENAGSVNGQDPRGAHNEVEFERQASKIVAALDAIDADVVGLIEIQNDDDTAIKDLVTRLNAVSDRTYAAVETGVVGGDAIKVGFIYDTETVRIAPGTTVAVLDTPEFVAPVSTLLDPNDRLETDPKNRPAVAVTFEEIATGETFTAVNNHLKSKGSAVDGEDQNLLVGSDLGTIDGVQPVTGVDDGQGNGSATREAAADQLVDWLATNPTGSADADLLIIGDLNAYAEETAIAQIKEGADDTAGTGDDFTDLAQTFIGDTAYSFRFSGQWGTLDYALANDALLGQVTGVTEWHANSDEPAFRDYNDATFDANERSFDAKPEALDDQVDPASPFRSSDHDPVIVGLNLGPSEPEMYTLELIHFTDQEPLQAGASFNNITNASGIVEIFRAEDLGGDGLPDNTLTLSSGDAVIPGLFYSASADAFGSEGIADIQIQNELGVQAIAFGNHEFDDGPAVFASLIDGTAPGDFSALSGTALDGQDFGGTDFPYLSTNLDFSTNPDTVDDDGNPVNGMADLEVAGGAAPQPNTVTSSTVIDVNGEPIAVVGATTPRLASISSPGPIGIEPTPFDPKPTTAQIQALAAVIQQEVDAILAANPDINKVVLLAHMQDLEIEKALVPFLTNVDIIVGGGSNTRLFDDNDRILPGDTDQGEYPTFITNAGGTQTAVVNTDGSYKYVGRLVVDFDADGNIIRDSYDPDVSGGYATDAAGLLAAAAVTGLDLEMSEAQQTGEVPDTAATGGFEIVEFDADNRVVTISGSFEGLKDANADNMLNPVGAVDAEGNPISAIHLHNAPAGENGAIVRNFAVTDNGDGSGSFTGTFTLTDAEFAALVAGETYVNLHTTDFGSGQLRGQVDVSGLIDPEIQAIVDAIEEQIILTEGNVFGQSDVFLNGNRSGEPQDGVRTQETNLGNLTADANLVYAKSVDSEVMISIKNGGGIRANIGETVVPAGGTEPVRQPNGEVLDGEGNLIKPQGGISENDIKTTLAFNNGLVVLTLTTQEIVDILEHGVAALPNVSGQFPQIGGVEFAFDPAQPEGSQITSAAIVDETGATIVPLVFEGEIVGDPQATYKVVTLDFLSAPRFDDDGNFIGAGDGYPFPNTNTDPAVGEVGDPDVVARVNRTELELAGDRDGAATFADTGSEQDALAEYLNDNFNPDNGGTAFAAADTTPEFDTRIQNLEFRNDDVFEFDELFVGTGDRVQRFDLTEGVDLLFVSDDLSDGVRQRFLVDGFEAGDLVGFDREDILFSREAGPNLLVYIDNAERDSFTFYGVENEDALFGPSDLPLS